MHRPLLKTFLAGNKGFVNETEYLVGKPDFVGIEEAHAFADGAAALLAAEGKQLFSSATTKASLHSQL